MNKRTSLTVQLLTITDINQHQSLHTHTQVMFQITNASHDTVQQSTLAIHAPYNLCNETRSLGHYLLLRPKS